METNGSSYRTLVTEMLLQNFTYQSRFELDPTLGTLK